jgi:hypothetical protein
MTRSTEVPQTIRAAVAFGWGWLHVQCLGCKHAADVKFIELPGPREVKLAFVASKLVCKQCKGRRLEFALGAYISDAGQLWPSRRRIEFQAIKRWLHLANRRYEPSPV